ENTAVGYEALKGSSTPSNNTGVGNGIDKSHLGTIDVSGVALKGVQALIDKIEFQKEEIDTLKSELDALKNLVQTLINDQ
ncbi:hypothetical protein OAW17_04745, partial [Flavobacteriaceae bacterium]|nr:hypothetical protein [Flavobacteriaceae bacterium]